MLRPYLQLLRPQQWVKNGFVLVGVLFSHSWGQPELVTAALLAFAAFSLAASSIYVGNDYMDREQDRLHPRKCRRPLAAGTVRPAPALVLGLGCAAGALALGAWVSPALLLIIAVYLALNLGYSLGWKHIPVLDVSIIAAGFMLRILAGTKGIGIVPSYWLLLCGLMVTLFLGFAKRRAELNTLDEDAGSHRKVLTDYDTVLLDQLISICAAATIVSYSLYTVSAETVALHGTRYLVYTVPFVVYGIFRYLFLLHRRGGGGDPTTEILDSHLLVTAGLWLGAVLWLLS
ncbi:prenyltransferase, UbiA family [Oryzomicrobium terrae]|uniref:Prenyltransferase, UbiA family n=1 Tax=Oryzomicrobium terrae TaxID=1735038 RepID=A0A5C1EBY3_9RHOO|nr:decaprenyl-phosphate phosphoribosyltransferase [Oryzomicrobium terrae]QEL65768.1 prenyltransferase, UbiA family [Oryzomicrobium terrae]